VETICLVTPCKQAILDIYNSASCGISCLDRYEVRYLGQSVHNYPKGIISRLTPRQSHDEIHSNPFPRPLGYSRVLEYPSGSLMLGLDSLIGVTKFNMLGNVSLHSVPPIDFLQIMVHLIPSWVSGISGFASLMKYLVLQFLDVSVGSNKTSISCANMSSKCIK
jgi:hypothetical protein